MMPQSSRQPETLSPTSASLLSQSIERITHAQQSQLRVESQPAPTKLELPVEDTRGTPAPEEQTLSATHRVASVSATEVAQALIVPATSLNDLNLPALDQPLCYEERDRGLLEAISTSRKRFCGSSSKADDETAIDLYHANGGITASVLTNFQLNLSNAQVARPITDLSSDGCDHDPRFILDPDMVQCRCSEIGAYARARGGAFHHLRQIWSGAFAEIRSENEHALRLCDTSAAPLQVTQTTATPPTTAVVHIHERVVLIARRDDHNPFFQVSSALNAWVVAKAVNWDLAHTRVLHLDAGFASPVDELHEKLFSSGSSPAIGTQTLVGRTVHFHSPVLIAPPESAGPMMQHLDDDEPCFKSQLLLDFRTVALETMGVADAQTTTAQAADFFTVTIISRRHYDGRKIQRVWVNEDDILRRMRLEYQNLHVRFQSIDFVHLPMVQQMETVLSSDVVVGMHGAGLVNVLWSRPGTLVVEIFPKQRFRWGYRNLCQFVGCDWHEFRGGCDYGGGRDPNSKDKLLDYVDWIEFFDPLLRKRYSDVETQHTADTALY